MLKTLPFKHIDRLSVSPRALTSRGESLIRDAISVNKSVTTYLFTVENLNIFPEMTYRWPTGKSTDAQYN